MMCMTELHGGVCHRTSTPHKSGNKMKEKKNFFYCDQSPEFMLLHVEVQCHLVDLPQV